MKTHSEAYIASKKRLGDRLRGVKRKPEHIAAMLEANKKRRKPPPVPHPCECGCGEMTINRFVFGHAHRGRKRSAAHLRSMSEGMKRAYTRPEALEKFKAACEARKAKTLQKRALCACGCGNRVGRSGAKFYSGHWTTADATKCRDLDALRPRYSERMKEANKQWKESGQLDVYRRKSRLAKGMVDHLAAKRWQFRSPEGLIYDCTNLTAWARRNINLFTDDRPESKSPFWLRVSQGLAAILGGKEHVCSYRGWVGVSKSELADGAPDPLARVPFLTTPQPPAVPREAAPPVDTSAP